MNGRRWPFPIQDRLHYFDMVGFYRRRSEKEKEKKEN